MPITTGIIWHSRFMWLCRIVPTALFFGCAVPLYLRALRGVIPAGDGIDKPIDRRTEPRRFWKWMSLYLLIAVAITVWCVLAWYFPVPDAEGTSNELPGL